MSLHRMVQVVFASICFIVFSANAWSQAEIVPAHDPVYDFLKTMEVKGIIDHYSDAVLPLSRADVARHLHATDLRRERLSGVEQERLNDYLSEFHYELTGSVSRFDALLSASGNRVDSVGSGIHPDRERVVVLHADSVATLFMNGLVSADTRQYLGRCAGKSCQRSFSMSAFGPGGRCWGHLGYTFRMTNAQFWGSRELLSRDERIAQSHALGVGNIQNFDLAEGSVRYDAGFVSAEIGRERVLWGTSVFDEKMVLSDHPRAFDFIRADVSYGVFRYTFLHAWILGSESRVFFYVGNDSSIESERAGDRRQVLRCTSVRTLVSRVSWISVSRRWSCTATGPSISRISRRYRSSNPTSAHGENATT